MGKKFMNTVLFLLVAVVPEMYCFTILRFWESW